MVRFFKKIVIFLVALAFFYYVANYVLNSYFFQKKIISVFTSLIDKNTPFVAKIEAFDVSILSTSVIVNKIILKKEKQHKDEHYIVSIDKVTLKLSVYDLMLGKEKFLGLKIKSPSVQIKKSYKYAKKPSAKQTPYKITLEELKAYIFKSPVKKISAKNLSLKYQYSKLKKGKILQNQLHIIDASVFTEARLKGDLDLGIKIGSFTFIDEGDKVLNEAFVLVSGAWRKDKIYFQKITAKANNLDLKGSMRGFFKENSDNYLDSLNLDFKSSITGDLEILGAYLDIDNTFGKVVSDFKVNVFIPIGSYRESDFSITGTGSIFDARIDNYLLHKTNIRYFINEEGMTFRELNIKKGKKIFAHGRGYIGFNFPGEYRFYLDKFDSSLEELMQTLHVDYDAVDFNIKSSKVELVAKGEPFKMNIKIKPTISNIHLNQAEKRTSVPKNPCYLNLNIFVDERKLSFNNSSGSFKTKDKKFLKNKVFIKGDINFKSDSNLRLEFKDFDFGIAKEIIDFDIDGYGDVDLSIGKALSADVYAEDFYLMDFPLGLSSGTLKINKDQIKWNNVVSSLETTDISSSGTYNIKSKKISLDLKANALSETQNQQALKTISMSPYAFNIDSIYGHIEGHVKSLAKSQGKLSVKLSAVTYEENLIAEQMSFDLQRLNSNLNLQNGTLFRKGFLLDFFGNIKEIGGSPFSPVFGLHNQDKLFLEFKENEKSEGRFKSFLDLYKTNDFILNFDSDVKLSGKVEGRLSSLFSKIDISLSDIYYKSKSKIPGIDLRLLLSKEKLELIMNQKGKQSEGFFNVDLKNSQYPYELYLSFNEQNLYFFLPDSTNYRNYFYVTADLKLQGTLLQDTITEGSLALKNVNLFYNTNNIETEYHLETYLDQPYVFSFNSSNPTWGSYRSNFSKGLFRLAKNSANKEINFFSEGEFDVGILKRLNTDFSVATGKILYKLKLEDILSTSKYNLKVYSNVDAENQVSLGVKGFHPPVVVSDLDLELNNNFIQVNAFKAKKGDGFITSNGSLNLNKEFTKKQNEIYVNLENIGFDFEPDIIKKFNIAVDGELLISGTSWPLDVTGALELKKAYSITSYDLIQNIINSGELLSTSRDQLSLPQKNNYIKYNLLISSDDNIIIKNATLSTKGSVNLNVLGFDSKPYVVGALMFNEGKFYYLQDFTITGANINFDEINKNDPIVNIRAVSNINKYIVSLQLQDRMSDPTVSLSIEPSTDESGIKLSQDQIVFLIKNGYIPPIENDIRDIGAEVGANILTNQLTFGLLDKFMNKNIYVYPSWSSDISSESSVPQLGVAANISLYKSLRVKLSSYQMFSDFTLSYLLARNLEVDVTGKQTNDVNVKKSKDLNLNLKFRFPF